MNVNSMYLRRLAKLSKTMSELTEHDGCYFSEAEKYRQLEFWINELGIIVAEIGEIVDSTYSTVSTELLRLDCKGDEK